MAPQGSTTPAARAIGSAGERLVHTEEVTGSIPVSPTPVSGLLGGSATRRLNRGLLRASPIRVHHVEHRPPLAVGFGVTGRELVQHLLDSVTELLAAFWAQPKPEAGHVEGLAARLIQLLEERTQHHVRLT